MPEPHLVVAHRAPGLDIQLKARLLLRVHEDPLYVHADEFALGVPEEGEGGLVGIEKDPVARGGVDGIPRVFEDAAVALLTLTQHFFGAFAAVEPAETRGDDLDQPPLLLCEGAVVPGRPVLEIEHLHRAHYLTARGDVTAEHPVGLPEGGGDVGLSVEHGPGTSDLGIVHGLGDEVYHPLHDLGVGVTLAVDDARDLVEAVQFLDTLGELPLPLGEVLLGAPDLGDVPDDAIVALDGTAWAAAYAGGKQAVDDGAILSAKLQGIGAHGAPGLDLLLKEGPVAGVRIDLADIFPHDLVARVAEQLDKGLVGLDDHPVARGEVQGVPGIFEEHTIDLLRPPGGISL